MGQCSSSGVSDSAIVANKEPETEAKGGNLPPPIEFQSEQEQQDYVRKLAGVVLEGYQRNLDEYGKVEFAKDDDSHDVDWRQRDRIVNPLKAEFNPLMDRMKSYIEQQRTHTTFLISRTKLQELGLTYYPKHEEALQMEGLLKRVEIDDMRMKLCREANRGIHTHFISHKWDGHQPDTDDHAIFEMSKSAAHYMWFDYTCVPQDNHEERLKHLLSIANILHEATVITCHANEMLEEAYNHSVWCQLEAALLQWDKVEFQGGNDVSNMEWSIYDWNDLYTVLPGFLDLWVNSEKNHHFFNGREGFERSKMVVSLLQAFVNHHDENAKRDDAK